MLALSSCIEAAEVCEGVEVEMLSPLSPPTGVPAPSHSPDLVVTAEISPWGWRATEVTTLGLGDPDEWWVLGDPPRIFLDFPNIKTRCLDTTARVFVELVAPAEWGEDPLEGLPAEVEFLPGEHATIASDWGMTLEASWSILYGN